MKPIKRLIALAVVAAVVVGVFGILRLLHEAAVARQNTTIATQMAAQGVSGFGSPNSAAGVVPVYVSPGCSVNFTLVNPNANYANGQNNVTLELKYYDGTGRLIGNTDVIHDAQTASLVRQSLVATLKANPNNQICAS